MKEYLLAWKLCFKFNGCSSRKEFWIFYFVNLVISLVATLLAYTIVLLQNQNNSVELLLFLLTIFISMIYLIQVLPQPALWVRRLHDIGHSGWWLLTLLIPISGSVLLSVFSLIPSKQCAKLHKGRESVKEEYNYQGTDIDMKSYHKLLIDFKGIFRDCTNFSGRTGVAAFWSFVLINFLIFIILTSICYAVFSIENNLAVFLLVYLASTNSYVVYSFVPSLALCVRRLHDTGRSGWWLLLALIPLIGSIILIIFYASEGDRGPNAYGPDPKQVDLGQG